MRTRDISPNRHNTFNDKNYDRVLPRDLFNEAKLLKDLGFLVLAIHDGEAPDGLEFRKLPPSRFIVSQNRGSGDLIVKNLSITIKEDPIYLYHPYNEKEGPTLRFMIVDMDDNRYDGKVFDEEGKFSKEFKQMCQEYDTPR